MRASNTSSVAPTSLVTGRLDFLDPIRVLLTLLVIAHHASITYGGAGDWYYKEAGAPELTRILLSVFTGTNQSFFMGFFFLLAGHFTPISLARKGESAYLGERLWRLGFPMLIFSYLLSPLTNALAAAARGADFLTSFGALIDEGDFGLGPLWFNQALIFFAVIWAFRPRFSLPRWLSGVRIPFHAGIAAAILGCGFLALCLRSAVPVGKSIMSMQIGYFASYIILFFGGCIVAKSRLIERVTFRHALPWLVLSLIAFPAFWLYAALSGAFGSDEWRGGWSLAAIAYAFWEPIMAAGVILTSLALFRRFYSGTHRFWKRLSEASFLTYVVHAPVTVACSWGVQGTAASFLFRFLFAAALSCVFSFAIGVFLTEMFAAWKAFREKNAPV